MDKRNEIEYRNLQELKWSLKAQVESMWQRARINWAKLGDRNTIFFHSCASWRYHHNAIIELKVDGDMVTQPTEITNLIFEFFQRQFKDDDGRCFSVAGLNFQRLNSDECLGLEATIDGGEIKKAVGLWQL